MLYLSFLNRMIEQYGEADCSFSKATLKEVKEFFKDGYIISHDDKTIVICKKDIKLEDSQENNLEKSVPL